MVFNGFQGVLSGTGYYSFDDNSNKFDDMFLLFLIRGSTPEEATNDVINCQIPKLQELIKNQEITVDNIDVFCEKGVFGLEDTRKILEAGKAAGLAINFHGDELHPMKAAEVIFHL